ncbi:MAG: LPS assembly lipoprotein LptE [Rhodospirillales bacterium]
MWSFSRITLLLVAAAVSGCGFQPLYGQRENSGSTKLAIDVMPIADRDGQVLRAGLRRSFDFSSPAVYRMEVKLSEKLNVVAIDQAGDVTRRRMTKTANWQLTKFTPTKEERPIRGVVRVFEAYNVFASDFSNLTAERAARERAAGRLAEMIAIDVTAKLRRN